LREWINQGFLFKIRRAVNKMEHVIEVEHVISAPSMYRSEHHQQHPFCTATPSQAQPFNNKHHNLQFQFQ
ncbi:hypothetical protein MKW98_021700, partial [Papaver atlanticum]